MKETKEQVVDVDLFFFLVVKTMGLCVIGLWNWKNGWCHFGVLIHDGS